MPFYECRDPACGLAYKLEKEIATTVVRPYFYFFFQNDLSLRCAHRSFACIRIQTWHTRVVFVKQGGFAIKGNLNFLQQVWYVPLRAK